MRILRFDRWCSLAVSGIRFKPDRKEIYEELYAHMEDQYEELTAAGLSEKEAEDEVAAAMGDPKETARQLERIHRPFWAFALRAARVCLVIAAVLALFTVPWYIKGLEINDTRFEDNLFRETWDDGDGEQRLIWYAEPTVSGRCDGYTFTVTRAAQRSVGQGEGIPVGPVPAHGLTVPDQAVQAVRHPRILQILLLLVR